MSAPTTEHTSVGWRTWALLAAAVVLSAVILALADPWLLVPTTMVSGAAAMLVSESARRILGWTLAALVAALVAAGLVGSFVADLRDGDAVKPGGGLRGAGSEVERP